MFNEHDMPAEMPAEEQKPITVEELDKAVDDLFKLREEKDAIEATLTEKNKEIMALQAKITIALRQHNRENYKTPAGTVSIVTTWAVTTPKGDQDKSAFFDWLKGQGESVFLKYATVNYNSLQSLYKEEWEAAKKRGEGMEFVVPGIAPPKPFETIRHLKARKK